MNALTRPIMRYPGGKWKLARRIISHFPGHMRYVEPYVGAGSVLMKKHRVHSEYINDLDGNVVNVFRVLRDTRMARELERQLKLTPFAREEFLYSYEPTGEPVERARRTLIRAFMGHSSASVNPSHRTGYRSKAFRRGRSPAGDWQNYNCFIPLFTERLQGVNIENRPALEMIRHLDSPETLFYVDPPYPTATRFGEMYSHEMCDEDHARLLGCLLDMEGMVVLSSYENEMYSDILKTWRKETFATFADGARPRTEVLWISPNIPVPVHLESICNNQQFNLPQGE
ncbi:MAG: DNA adenine methylase [Nitrospinota bacterium]|nr:DNA adenine methylase [Nitrospinota bacterium]